MEKKLHSLKGLKRARKQKSNMTQQDLADSMNVSLKTVMNWEQGLVVPGLDVMMKLSELLDCDLDFLTGRLSEQTHDIQFIHDQTGLTGDAVKKMQENRGLSFVLSLLIEQKDFIGLLVEINRKLVTSSIDHGDDHETEDFINFQIARYLTRILEAIPIEEYWNRFSESEGKPLRRNPDNDEI